MDPSSESGRDSAASRPGLSAGVRYADESSLVQAVLQKDRKATAEFIQRYSDPVYLYLSRRLAPRADLVDDMFQQVFLDAWEALPGFRGDSSVQNWLLGIARHKVQDHYRARLRLFEISDEGPEPADSAGLSEWVESMDVRRRVHAVLDELPEPYRLVLLWRYWERESAQQMARRVGKSEKAIERLLARAREQFRRRWYSE